MYVLYVTIENWLNILHFLILKFSQMVLKSHVWNSINIMQQIHLVWETPSLETNYSKDEAPFINYVSGESYYFKSDVHEKSRKENVKMVLNISIWKWSLFAIEDIWHGDEWMGATNEQGKRWIEIDWAWAWAWTR